MMNKWYYWIPLWGWIRYGTDMLKAGKMPNLVNYAWFEVYHLVISIMIWSLLIKSFIDLFQ